MQSQIHNTSKSISEAGGLHTLTHTSSSKPHRPRDMIFLLYTLINEIPESTWSKDRSCFSLMVHIFGEVLKSLLEMIMALVAIDILSCETMISSDAKAIMADYMIGGLMILIPCTTILITSLICTGVMIEVPLRNYEEPVVEEQTVHIVGWQQRRE